LGGAGKAFQYGFRRRRKAFEKLVARRRQSSASRGLAREHSAKAEGSFLSRSFWESFPEGFQWPKAALKHASTAGDSAFGRADHGFGREKDCLARDDRGLQRQDLAVDPDLLTDDR
jgi:hypothetical protein